MGQRCWQSVEQSDNSGLARPRNERNSLVKQVVRLSEMALAFCEDGVTSALEYSSLGE